jgi:hypothetical protein
MRIVRNLHVGPNAGGQPRRETASAAPPCTAGLADHGLIRAPSNMFDVYKAPDAASRGKGCRVGTSKRLDHGL